ncbi:type II toxin-antitoxin system RelE/ParE family toxin [Helicobacter felistomachi]|uniref:type II toxin-antitoxin system RelE/ParE family toxin n=1 Tax=Helicobacter felistomachi TaxID=3040201 RepID=UPI002574484B|nr:type II toxin-antitoxin system RelE/ParE family toxin [Helicobacter sp. NHP21005]
MKAHGVILRRLRALEQGHFGDCKHTTKSIFELRVHVGPGYRLYCSKQGDTLVILLCGGDKSTQKRDIEKAQEILKEFPWK